ncbi:MAG: hypothetical protein IAF38_18710 [Bacteroidia bacterium]|nr:hypothetical protein [Bacteroidia bacterium]
MTKPIPMKNIYLLFLFIGGFFYAQPQSYEMFNGKDTINYIDALGKKQRKWIVFGKTKPNTCYTPEGKVEQGSYTDNKKIGKWQEFFCNGNMKSNIEFQNGRPDGYAIMYNETGKISEEGTWKNNRWVGNYKLYYESGNVQHEFTFGPNGKRDGEQVYHWDDDKGTVMIKANMVGGKEQGTVTEFHPDGSVKKTVNYNNGDADVASIKEFQQAKPTVVAPKKEEKNAPKKEEISVKKTEEVDPGNNKGPTILNGYHTTYLYKQISKQGTFKDNLLMDGKAYLYDRDGKLQRIAVYKEGKYVGDAPIED